MRRQRLLRTTTPQSVCIFCTARLYGQSLVQPSISRSPLVSSPRRRHLNTTRPPHQSAAAAAQAEPEPNDASSSPSNAAGRWDAHSTLTPPEQAEKQRRLAVYRERLQAEQKAKDAQLAADREREQRHQQQMETEHRTRQAEQRKVRQERLVVEQEREKAQSEEMEKRKSAEDARVRKERQERAVSRSVFGDSPRPSQQRRGESGGVVTTQRVRSVSKPAFGMPSIEQSRPSRARIESEEEEVAIKPLQYRNEFETEDTGGFREIGEMLEPTPLRHRPQQSEIDRRHQSYRHGVQQKTRQDRNSPSYSENEYRTTPFDPTDYKSPQSRSPFEDVTNANPWQHLRPRSKQESPSSDFQRTLSRRPVAAAPRQEERSDDWIEQQFSEHQRQRPTHAPPQQSYSNPNIQTVEPGAPQQATPRAQQKCARCLQYGHSARECQGPVRGTCHVCGQVGHFASQCPERASQRQMRGSQNGPFGDQQSRNPAQPRAVVDVFGVDSATAKETEPVSKSTQPSSKGRYSPFKLSDGSDRSTVETTQPKTPADTITSSRNESQEVEETRQAERRARLSTRGFEDEAATAEATLDRRPRRQSRRSMVVEDDEAEDDAAASREERAARKAARKSARKAERTAERREKGAQVHLPDFVSVANLAQLLGVRYEAFVARLGKLGYDDIFAGKVLERDVSALIAMEFSFDPIFEDEAGGKKGLTEQEERDLSARPDVEGEDRLFLPSRPPVVTIMGHVDHGKTTLLDFLRKSSVAAGEAGGITQHIGAFSVPLTKSGKSVTFLDTPGHAAFLAMRQRGANVTDIVILVVAADDSVKPQTLESLRCAKEARVPIIVAINKIDKPEADVQAVKQDLARNGVEIEEFGGEIQVVGVSGKTGEGMQELEEAVVTLSEILDHRAEVIGEVEGWVLEATTKKAGRVATVLVKRGTLKPGAVIVAGKTWARVRTLRNEAGLVVHEVGPGLPVEVDGWRDQPVAGDEVLQAGSEQKAGDVVEYRIEKAERGRMAEDMEAINVARKAGQDKRKAASASTPATESADGAEVAQPELEPGQLTIPFIIKADVSGSAEAVSAYIPSLTSPYIIPQILQASVGPIHESDIELASAAQGHIIAFNLPAQPDMKAAAEAAGVRVLENNVIYRVLDDVKEVLEEKLPPIVTQRVLGEAEIGAAFDIKVAGAGAGKKVVWIAGCKVRNGVVRRASRARVLREGMKVYDGTITSLKNVKKDVQEMRKGTECGMGFDGWEGFEIGDLVQTYEEISEKRRL